MASPSSSMSTSLSPVKPCSERFEWLIVVMKYGVPTVYSVELHSRMTGTTAMHAIRKAYKEANPSAPWYHSRPHLEDAVLSSISLSSIYSLFFTVNPDPGAQDYPRAVIIKSSEPRLELTKAFHNPSLLNGTGTTLVIENLLFSPAANRCPTDSHHHALLIKTRASRWLIAFGVVGAIVVAGAVGCVVGYFAGNAELGVAAGAVVVVVLTFVQGCILFL